MSPCSVHLTPSRENFPTQQHMYRQLRLICPIFIELLYTTNLVAYTAPFLTSRVSGKCTNQRSCQAHNVDEASSSHNIFASPPFTALRSTTQPTPCLPRPSILRAGRRLRSCCSTLVSNRSCLESFMLGQKPLQPAFSIPASAMHTALLQQSGQRTPEEHDEPRTVAVAHAVSPPSPGCYPRLCSRHDCPSHPRVSIAPGVRNVTQNQANHTISLT